MTRDDTMASPHLWFLVLASGWIFILAFMYASRGIPLLDGHLSDPDDYLRMVRVFELMDGNHHSSAIQPRLGPAGNTENNWSRLGDLPLWGLMTVLEPPFRRFPAALLTATITPALALLALLFGSVWYARSLNGLKPVTPGYVVMILVIVFMQWGLLGQFTPGRVDHHMWQIVLTLMGYSCVIRSCLAPQGGLKYAVAAGIAFATGLAIGADMVPWFALAAAFPGLCFLISGRMYERRGLFLGLSATVTCAVYLLLLHPYRNYLATACDGLSATYVSFAAAVMIFWFAVLAMPAEWKRSAPRRLILSATLSIVIVYVLFRLFPGCFHDPYSIQSPLVRKAWLDNVVEAQPLLSVLLHSPAFGFALTTPVLCGLIASVTAAVVEKEHRIIWIGIAAIIASGLALSLWEVRVLELLQGLCILPLAWILPYAQSKTSAKRKSFPTFVFVCVILSVSIAMFGISLKRHGAPNATIAKAESVERQCDLSSVAPALDKIEQPRMIAAFFDRGSEILYRTHHNVLAAPYHHDAEGIEADIRFFTAPDASIARPIADKYGIDIVMLCPAERPAWAKISLQKDFFAAQILDGKIPAWLEPFVEQKDGMRVYRVSRR